MNDVIYEKRENPLIIRNNSHSFLRDFMVLKPLYGH